MKGAVFPSAAGPRRGRRANSGFTLVELMVALTGGLFLSIVVFALSRDTGRFYQQETRVANATLAGLAGFERLSSDIARAGHLVSPNIANDPRVCNRPAAGAGWPALIQNFRSIVIDPAAGVTSVTGTEVAAAGIAPMQVELAGALDATEELPIRTITPNGSGGWDVFLQTGVPAAARLGGLTLASLGAMFTMADGTGRAVRIVDKEGMEQYGVVAAVTVTPQPTVSLAATPGLLFRTSTVGSALCGFKGFNTGATINAINFVRYNLRKLKGVPASGYTAMFTAAASAPFEDNRVELVREELTPAGVAVDATREIVAEYAVDLQLTPLSATSPVIPSIVTIGAASVSNAFASTQLLRGVHVRLSVRSREADRLVDVPNTPAGDLFRIALGSGVAARFARVRTFQADVPIRNHQGANW